MKQAAPKTWPRDIPLLADDGRRPSGTGIAFMGRPRGHGACEPAAGRDLLAARAADLDRAFALLDVGERLSRFRQELDGTIVFTTGFGMEGQAGQSHFKRGSEAGQGRLRPSRLA